MPTEAVKGTDRVKFLAFQQLARERADPTEVRAVLGISRATYYRYLKIHDRLLAGRRRERD